MIVENCEDIPTSNAISYNGKSNIDNEMIDASRTQNFHLLKFGYSEKATNIWPIFYLLFDIT